MVSIPCVPRRASRSTCSRVRAPGRVRGVRLGGPQTLASEETRGITTRGQHAAVARSHRVRSGRKRTGIDLRAERAVRPRAVSTSRGAGRRVGMPLVTKCVQVHKTSMLYSPLEPRPCSPTSAISSFARPGTACRPSKSTRPARRSRMSVAIASRWVLRRP